MQQIRSISFEAAGFNVVYYIGVLHFLDTHRALLHPKYVALGCSSGSMIAVLLCCRVPLHTIMHMIEPMLQHSRKYRDFWRSAPKFIQGLQKILPDDAYKRCTNRCSIAYSQLYLDWGGLHYRPVRKSVFESNEELLRVMRASCCVPFVTDVLPPWVDNAYGVDGVFTDSLPIIDHRTIRVSTSADHSDAKDVYPPDSLQLSPPMHMRVPSEEKTLAAMRQGYADARYFFARGDALPRVPKKIFSRTKDADATTTHGQRHGMSESRRGSRRGSVAAPRRRAVPPAVRAHSLQRGLPQRASPAPAGRGAAAAHGAARARPPRAG